MAKKWVFTFTKYPLWNKFAFTYLYNSLSSFIVNHQICTPCNYYMIVSIDFEICTRRLESSSIGVIWQFCPVSCIKQNWLKDFSLSTSTNQIEIRFTAVFFQLFNFKMKILPILGHLHYIQQYFCLFIGELMELLCNNLNDKHHVRLEWYIILLIIVEVIFEFLHFFR